MVLIRAIEHREHNGGKIVSAKGHDHLRAAHPQGSVAPPMPMLGTRVLFSTFSHADTVFSTRVRVMTASRSDS